jgi:hypothetical protein
VYSYHASRKCNEISENDYRYAAFGEGISKATKTIPSSFDINLSAQERDGEESDILKFLTEAQISNEFTDPLLLSYSRSNRKV